MKEVALLATGQYSLGGNDLTAGSLITFKTVGLTGTCSVIPKVRRPGDGSTNMVAVPYTNVNTDVTVAAGTAITADGVYQITATGPETVLDATVTSGTATVDWWIATGIGGGGSGGGGTGGSVTLASAAVASGAYSAGSLAAGAAVSGAFVDGAIATIGSKADAAITDYTQPGSVISELKGISEILQGTGAGAVVPVKQQDGSGNVQPAGDIAGRPIFNTTQGQVADGSSSSGVSSLLIGGNDAGGLARTASNILLSSTPTSTSSYGISTYATVAAVGSANVVHPIGSGQNLGDAGNGSNYLAVVEGRWNEVTFDRQRGNTQIQLLSSAVHTTATSADLINYNGRALSLVCNITAGAGSVVIMINGKEIGGTTYYLLLQSGSLSGVSSNVLHVGLGNTVTATISANLMLPRTFQVIYTVTGSLTFSLGYNIGL